MQNKKVLFTWEKEEYQGRIEKEYQNSYLIEVADPCLEMIEKYAKRMVVSKRNCHLLD